MRTIPGILKYEFTYRAFAKHCPRNILFNHHKNPMRYGMVKTTQLNNLRLND